MFLVYGITTDSDWPVIWEVALFEKESAAKKFAKRCKQAAFDKFNSELANGFDYGDSINIRNVFDPHAQYNRYSQAKHNKSGQAEVDIEYLVREIPVITSIKTFEREQMFNTLKGTLNLGRSYKWPDQGTPAGWSDDDDEPYTMLRDSH